MNDKIDIIVPWVDGSDSTWLKEKELWYERCGKDKKTNSDIRFQSWDNLKYWFRAIEKFMPWVNKICFVTWGHLPDFLDISNPKLKIIRHKDYIPERYLPTYNSNTIEMNYHRIQDLEENFIIFNDDFFPLQPIAEEYYFMNNTVCDEAIEGHIVPVDTGLISNMAKYVQVNNLTIINRYFHKRNVQDKNWDKWFCKDYGELLERNKSLHYWYDFSGFRDPHMASAMKKSTLRRLWEVERIELDTASKNHFRDYTDVSQYLIRYWQLCEGDFCPRRTLGKFYAVNIENCEEIAKAIERQEWQMISINENCVGEEFEVVKKRINKAFEKVLPEKSSYEI